METHELKPAWNRLKYKRKPIVLVPVQVLKDIANDETERFISNADHGVCSYCLMVKHVDTCSDSDLNAHRQRLYPCMTSSAGYSGVWMHDDPSTLVAFKLSI